MEIGRIILDLAPSADNPRNGEGAFITLKNGNILYAYSRFSGNSHEDDAPADIYAVESSDGGETFSEPRMLFCGKDENAENIMSVSFLHMNNGDIGLFYGVRETYDLGRMHLRRSSDEGKTWSESILCMPQQGYFVVANDKVVMLSDGTIMIPSSYHRKGFCVEDGDDGFFMNVGTVIHFVSRDDGYTWEANGSPIPSPAARCSTGLQEPGVLELKNGVLWGWARTDLGRQYEMFSMDGGYQWTSAMPSRFTGPPSPMSIKRACDGRLWAVWNPVPNHNGCVHGVGSFWHGGRNVLALAASSDDGNTFSAPIILEKSDLAGYCYVAIHFTEDAILLGYNAGNSEDGSCNARSRIRKIRFSELEELIKPDFTVSGYYTKMSRGKISRGNVRG